MAWQIINGAGGLPVWRGQDTIFNALQEPLSKNLSLKRFILISLILAGLITIASGSIELFVGFVPLALFLGFVYAGVRNGQKSPEFVGHSWALAAAPDALTFKGQKNWTVPLDAVARVETGRTAEFMPERDFSEFGFNVTGWKPVPTSKHEYQTFLFLNDGTRRVIYHANAARDDCAALAASIREYVESARAGAAPSSPAASGVADAPRAAGFDL